jgi:(1->4)-alpha-D-glucan 1-alpha-D-glucosylmutase
MTGLYRLQLRPEFGFAAAAEQLDYLLALGVSHVLLSPILTPAEGSTHGYDVADPTQVNPELGGEQGFARFAAAARTRGLGLVLDIVPNHMCISTRRNRWWWDVLRHGPASAYAHYFDVDWTQPLLLPWLGKPLAAVLAAGELKLDRVNDKEPRLLYHGLELPLAHGSAPQGDALAAILARQHYRLAHWTAGDHELSYRRFFDVNHLIGVRVEVEDVFLATHARILDWLRDGVLAGVRIDHLDGLREPARYLERLRAAAPDACIVVEKILARDEALPAWPIAGTTGYDFLNRVQRVFLDPHGAAGLQAAYDAFAGPQPEFAAVALAGKRAVLAKLLHSDVRRLGRMARRLAPRGSALRHATGPQLDAMVGEWAERLNVYRTYAPAAGPLEDADRLRLAAAAVPDYLLREREFLLSFQQLTPAVMAKGVEDTAFYRSFRLAALNEVGGDPDYFAISPAEFHAACAAAQRDWPHSLLNTSTHDTKRGEDVRARLWLLSEMADGWQEAALAWQRHNARYHHAAGPDANTEYLFYQTLVGAWPITPERMQAYMLKAVREAKVYTSWRQPHAGYEGALRRFIAAALSDARWLRTVAAFVEPLVAAGEVNSLAQLLLKLTAPGVPNVYNGAELWEFLLVDPDNRTPVDFALRRRELAAVARHPKLWLLQRALQLRRERPAAFEAGGDYRPLAAEGVYAEKVLAFTRGEEVVTVVPRLTMNVAGWPRAAAATWLNLPPGRWHDRLGGDEHHGRVRVSGLLAHFPVALLAREDAA